MSFRFPPEIEDEIFQWTVCTHPYRPTDAHLAVVSKQVRSCVEPILYHTIRISCTDLERYYKSNLENKLLFSLHSKPLSFFTKNVKSIIIATHLATPTFIAHLLTVCTGVTDISFWHDHGSSKICAQALTLPLRSLTAGMFTLQVFSTRVLPHVTRLTTYDHDGLSVDLIPSLHWLPALTHVQFVLGRYNIVIPECVRVVLDTVPGLQSVSIRVDDRTGWSGELLGKSQLKRLAEMDERVEVSVQSYSGCNKVGKDMEVLLNSKYL